LPGLIWKEVAKLISLKKTKGPIRRTPPFKLKLNKENLTFYIYPTSIWIPTGDATRADVSVPLKDLSEKHGFDLIVDGVVKFEAKEKRVTLKSGKVLDDFDSI